MTSAGEERRKWDRYYASLPSVEEDENIIRFRDEFVDHVADLLPDGGSILEAGCGAGTQSLALAKTSRYDVTLLDFSSEAIIQARRIFAQADVPAEFLVEDAFQPGKPEFELVFNAGVLEHYPFDQQVSLLQGMASRSKQYVLVLVPNFHNYWYWLWRIQKTAQGLWPFGKEIPSIDLAGAFEAAGLHYLGGRYLGSTWTESLIAGLEGVSPELSELLLQVHRSGLLPEAQTSYLVAALGGVSDVPVPKGWSASAHAAGEMPSSDVETITAALADALALQVGKEREAESLRAEFLYKLEALSSQMQRIEQTNTVELVQKVQEIEDHSLAALAERYQELEQRNAAAMDRRVQAFEKQLVERIRSIEGQSAAVLAKKIEEVERANARAFQEKLQEIERKNTAALAARIREFERQRAIDQAGVVRQIEHDHTAVLMGKIQEIEQLRAQVEALRPPPTPNVRQRLHTFLIRLFTRLGLISQAVKLKKMLKRVRHLFRKQVPSEVSYQAPVSPGHPAIPLERRVAVLTYTFFDFDGNDMYYGGAERYVLELARLIRGWGYYPEVYQCGNGYWVRYYQDLRVTGIDVGGDAERLAAEFQRLDHAEALTIYSPFSLAVSSGEAGSIGISHGVFWDYPGFQADRAAMQAVVDSCKHLDAIVSVDTNTINWMRASAADVADKFVYLPNFVDTDAFELNPAPDDQKIVILYPRRLYQPRGFWLVVEVLPEILDRYSQVAFHFVGRADEKEADYIGELIARYPGQIEWRVLPPGEMPQAYQQAHITIVPTVHSEGTSLSCLEALASGNAVIATNVGGLPNLILHRYNGLLIDVSAEALKGALVELIEDPKLRRGLAERGRQVATSFSLERWRSKWEQILSGHLTMGKTHQPQVAYFPVAPGIPWEGIKQRPHQLAVQLAEAGIETFWGNPTRRVPDLHPLVHILGPQDEINIRRPLVFVYYPFTYTTLDQFDDPFIVYDVLDDISIHETSDRDLPEGERAVDHHRRLLEEADLVITSSTVLYQRLKPGRPDVQLIPNGVDRGHFHPAVSKPFGDSLRQDEKPRIGFHGAIAEWFDDELLAEVANLRPNYEFVLLGEASIEIRHLKRLSNVTYQSAVDYEEIPRHVAGFDVGILPFRVSALTHAVRPLKVLEYLAMGKPVVAVPLQEIEDWPGVFCAETPREFVAKIDQALIDKNSVLTDEEVQEFLASAAWESTTKPLIDILLARVNDSA